MKIFTCLETNSHSLPLFEAMTQTGVSVYPLVQKMRGVKPLSSQVHLIHVEDTYNLVALEKLTKNVEIGREGENLYRKIFSECFNTCLMQYQRRLFFKNYSVYYLTRLFRLQFFYCWSIIKTHKVEYWVGDVAMSYGFETLSFYLARALKLNVCLVGQYHYRRFFYSVNPVDWGKFDCCVTDSLNVFSMDVRLKNKQIAPPNYLVHQKFFNFSQAVRAFLPRPWRVFGRGSFSYIIGKLLQLKYFVFGALVNDKWDQHFNASLIPQDVFQERFVFAPLHFQPEAGSVAWSGYWEEQLSFVEFLSNHVPDGWMILVKDHPAQNDSVTRDPSYFYRQLEYIKRVKVMPKSVSSSSIMLQPNCLGVATINGTAGLEGLKLGIPVYVSSMAWYSGIAGAFSNIDEFIDAALDSNYGQLNSFADEYKNLMRKTKTGIIQAFSEFLEDECREMSSLSDLQREELISATAKSLLAVCHESRDIRTEA